MTLGIVTDSTSDLPQFLIEEYGIEVVPTTLILEGREYADGAGISREDFYRRLPALRILPTTAAPSIGEFSIRYKKLFDRGCDHILSIHAAGALTAILNHARQAAAEFPGASPAWTALRFHWDLAFKRWPPRKPPNLG